MFFATYSDFLYYLQLTSHELATIWHKHLYVNGGGGGGGTFKSQFLLLYFQIYSNGQSHYLKYQNPSPSMYFSKVQILTYE